MPTTSFLINTQALDSGVQDVDVVFDPPFAAAPDLIIPVVDNISNDALKYLISAEVVAKSANGFTVRLSSAPNTSNYVLAWTAGSPAAIFQTLAAVGIKISALHAHATDLLDTDYFPFVHTNPIPVTKRLTWAVLRSFFPRLQASPPASPAAPGARGDIVFDGVWVYGHNGTLWGRSRMFQTAWDVAAGDDPAQSGVIELITGQGYIDIEFPVAFTSKPRLQFSFRNLSADTNKLMLVGQEISGDNDRSRIQLNTPADSANYELVWKAEL